MITRIGFFSLLLLLAAALISLCETNADARPFRRWRAPTNYSMKTANAQAGAVQRTTAKPVIPDSAPSISTRESAAANLTTQTTKTAPKITAVPMRGFSDYELLGLNFSELLDALPSPEREAAQSVVKEQEFIYARKIEEKYPNTRPEVTESLVKIAKAVHESKSHAEVSAIVREMPLSTRQLKSNEILAINQELAPIIDPEEFRAVHELNQFRMRSGLLPCVIDVLLCAVSRGHSSDMRRFGFFSHTSPVSGKSNFSMRASQMGARASAENIYMGSSNGSAANSAWANSSGHRANMLGGYSRVGVGRVGGFFTQMFGH